MSKALVLSKKKINIITNFLIIIPIALTTIGLSGIFLPYPKIFLKILPLSLFYVATPSLFIGIILMWSKTKWPMILKFTLTLILPLFLFLCLFILMFSDG